MKNREYKISIIDAKIEEALKLYKNCAACSQACSVDRTSETDKKQTICKASVELDKIKVASHTLHFGEEPYLVGDSGSGTVFFSGCNLSCVYCQNYQISNEAKGELITTRDLAKIFLSLQNKGALNINLVTATHTIYQVLVALREALLLGLNIPIVYNTNSYETIKTLKILDGLVDIYLPDIKYFENDYSKKYSNAKNYFNIAMNNIKEMKRQVGDILLDKNGIAQSGIIIRHLILPNNISGTYDVLLELKNANLTKSVISIMSQYSPQYKAKNFKELDSVINKKDYEDIISYALSLGFENILSQEIESKETYLPNFENSKNPFNI